MKLILEKIGNEVYAYHESERHFRRVEPTRGTPLFDSARLDRECDLSCYDSFHMIFDIKKSKKPKKGKK